MYSKYISYSNLNEISYCKNIANCISKYANLTSIGPCIMIYFYSKTNEMHLFLKYILFCSSTLHVSDGLSVHHQESKTVHTTSSVCQILLTAC